MDLIKKHFKAILIAIVTTILLTMITNYFLSKTHFLEADLKCCCLYEPGLKPLTPKILDSRKKNNELIVHIAHSICVVNKGFGKGYINVVEANIDSIDFDVDIDVVNIDRAHLSIRERKEVVVEYIIRITKQDLDAIEDKLRRLHKVDYKIRIDFFDNKNNFIAKEHIEFDFFTMFRIIGVKSGVGAGHNNTL